MTEDQWWIFFVFYIFFSGVDFFSHCVADPLGPSQGPPGVRGPQFGNHCNLDDCCSQWNFWWVALAESMKLCTYRSEAARSLGDCTCGAEAARSPARETWARVGLRRHAQPSQGDMCTCRAEAARTAAWGFSHVSLRLSACKVARKVVHVWGYDGVHAKPGLMLARTC